MSNTELRSWLESRDRAAEMRTFQDNFGVFGGVERRTFSHTVGETRKAGTSASGASDGSLKVVGHAAVFDSPSVEMSSPLGNFTEYIDARAFDAVLKENPDVLLTWDHDTRYVLGRTANDTLDLSVDASGLRYWSKVADTSYARDLQVLMEGGYLDQSSFLFRIAPGGEEWTILEDKDGNSIVKRTITQVGGLYDVCVCAAGAYPSTSSGIARTLAVEYAETRGFISVPKSLTQEGILEEFRALGDVAFGPEEGTFDLMGDLEKQLNKNSYYCLWSVVDVSVNLNKAIICNWDDYSYWVVSFTMEGDDPVLSDESTWSQVESAWVTTAEGYEANTRSAKIRREARMAENETAPVEETEVVETEAAPVAEVEAEVIEAEAPAVEEAEPAVEEPVVEEPAPAVDDDEPRAAAAKLRALAEARSRISHAKTL